MLQSSIAIPTRVASESYREKTERELRETDPIIRIVADEAKKYDMSFAFLWYDMRPYLRRFLVDGKIVNVTVLSYTKRSPEGRLHAQTRVPHPRSPLNVYDVLGVMVMTTKPKLFAAPKDTFFASGVQSIVIPLDGPAPNASYLFNWHEYHGFSCLTKK